MIRVINLVCFITNRLVIAHTMSCSQHVPQLYYKCLNNSFVDSYSRESSKTWGKDFKSLMEDFPDIRAELTASRALSWSGRSLYSCKGGYSSFIDDTFQNAQDACKEGIRSFLNEAGIDYIASTPWLHQSWVWVLSLLF